MIVSFPSLGIEQAYPCINEEINIDLNWTNVGYVTTGLFPTNTWLLLLWDPELG